MFVSEKLGGELPAIAPGLMVEKKLETMNFIGSTSDTIVFFYEQPGCLQIMDPELHSNLPRVPESIIHATPISNLERIEPFDETPLERINEIFGSQIDNNWCYYFKKADLAQQIGDWEQIVQLGDEAFAQGLWPAFKYERELIPFIQGYAHMGEWQEAYRLTCKTAGAVPAIEPSMCTLWERILQETHHSPERADSLDRLSNIIDCLEP